MNYIAVKNNSAVKYINTVEDYFQYVVNQYIGSKYIPTSIDIKELNDNKYINGTYIIRTNDSKILIVDKNTVISEGYLYNSNDIQLDIKDIWSLLKNDIENDSSHDNILLEHKFIDNNSVIEYKEFNIDTITDYSSILLITHNIRNSIDNQHDIIEHTLDVNDIEESELYIYDTNIDTHQITKEKFSQANMQDNMNILVNELLSTYNSKVLVINLDSDIMNDNIYHDVFNNRKRYNLVIIGIVKPSDINTKLNYDMAILYNE